MPLIRKEDLENHNKEGGLWIIIHGCVYDAQEFKADVRTDLVMVCNQYFRHEEECGCDSRS